tara:strand:+ start:4468 stop:4716 length:249 start_codon:yes stop_codon:yes gene_type:complete
VFIGAYVYALVAIILRELDIYVDERALVLFVMTVIVLAVIVIYLIRWVLHLRTFDPDVPHPEMPYSPHVLAKVNNSSTVCYR